MTDSSRPTVASLAAQVSDLAAQVALLEQALQDVDLARMALEERMDHRLDGLLIRLNDQQRQIDIGTTTHVTEATLNRELERHGRALDEAARQAYMALERSLCWRVDRYAQEAQTRAEATREAQARLLQALNERVELLVGVDGELDTLFKALHYLTDRQELVLQQHRRPRWNVRGWAWLRRWAGRLMPRKENP